MADAKTPPEAAPPAELGGGNELGATGLEIWSGYVREEFLRELQGTRGYKVYREMQLNDALIGGVLFAIKMLIRSVPWTVKPGGSAPIDDLAAEFLLTCQQDMEHTWDEFIDEVLSMLPYGYAYLEVVLKRRLGEAVGPGEAKSNYDDGRIGWRKIPIRSQSTIYDWMMTEKGELLGAWQQSPPKFQRVALPLTRCLLFRPSAHKDNPEGLSILRTAYRCFSEDTELLTDAGWVPVLDLTTEQKVATLSAGGAIEYQRPTEAWRYAHRGEMVHARSRFVDQLVTPNHRMWVRRAHLESFEFIEAADCNPTVSFRAHARWDAPDLKTIRVGEQDVDGDTWMRFLGYWIAEGHTWSNGSRHEVGLTQMPGATADRMSAVLDALPWSNYSREDKRGIRRWTFTRAELWEHLAPLGKARTKRIPRYVFDASARQLRLFLDAFVEGDGSTVGGWGDYDGTRVMFTSSPGLADDLAEVAFKAGFRATKRWEKRKGGFPGSADGIWVVALGKPFSQLRADWIVVPYDGEVGCITVPNGIVYARRNGKACWSGNSWWFKKNVENMEGIGLERDLVGFPVAWVPRELFDTDIPGNAAKLETYKDLVTKMKMNEQAGVVMPLVYDDKGNKKYDLQLLSVASRRLFDTGAIVNRWNQQIAMSVLADFILLGHEKVGSFALSDSKTDLFATAIGAWLDAIADVLNRTAIPRLFALNPEFATAKLPKFAHDDIETPDLDALGQYIAALSGAGASLFPDKELENYLRRAGGMPEAQEDAGQGEVVLSEEAERRAFFAYQLDAGVVRINEARAREGLDPIEGGDVTLPEFRALHPDWQWSAQGGPGGGVPFAASVRKAILRLPGSGRRSRL